MNCLKKLLNYLVPMVQDIPNDPAPDRMLTYAKLRVWSGKISIDGCGTVPASEVPPEDIDEGSHGPKVRNNSPTHLRLLDAERIHYYVLNTEQLGFDCTTLADLLTRDDTPPVFEEHPDAVTLKVLEKLKAHPIYEWDCVKGCYSEIYKLEGQGFYLAHLAHPSPYEPWGWSAHLDGYRDPLPLNRQVMQTVVKAQFAAHQKQAEQKFLNS